MVLYLAYIVWTHVASDKRLTDKSCSLRVYYIEKEVIRSLLRKGEKEENKPDIAPFLSRTFIIYHYRRLIGDNDIPC